MEMTSRVEYASDWVAIVRSMEVMTVRIISWETQFM